MAGLTKAPSDSTMKRLLSAAVKEGNIETAGRGPATKYKLTPQAHVTMPLDLATYFDKDIDEREIQESFNFDLIRDVLPKVEIFTKEELEGYEFEEGEDVRKEGERLAASYVNFYFSNNAVVMPAFGGENEKSDRRAQQIMEELCPDRKIIPVYARDILTGGGNIHCITQQIPL